MSFHELVLGGLPLSGDIADIGTDEGFRLGVYASGFSLGSSEAVLETVRSFWADGSSVRRTGSDNGTTTFRVAIEGSTHQEIAAGEAALRRVLPDDSERPVDLVWRPADGVSPASIRTILHGEMVLEDDDFDLKHLRRLHVYQVTLVHEPHVRSEFPSTVPALPVVTPADPVVINDCSSAAGWTASALLGPDPTITAAGGAITTSRSTNALQVVRLAGAVSFVTRPYLVVDWRQYAGDAGNGVVFGDGDGSLSPLAVRALDDGYQQSVFNLAGITTAVSLQSGSQRISIRHVEQRVSYSPYAKVSSRRFTVGGTERTPGSLHVQTAPGASSGLGKTAIFTAPVGPESYEPCLTPYRTTGVPVAGADSPTGSWVPTNGGAGIQHVIPSSALPQDSYSILALIKRDSGAGDLTFAFDSYTVLPGSASKAGQVLTTRTWSVPTGLHWISFGQHSLPTVRTSAGDSGFGLQCATAGVHLGGLWAFRAGEDCALTLVDAGHAHLWINSPEISGPGGPWISPTANPGDGWYPHGSGTLPEPHTFKPGEMIAHAVTLNADNPPVDLAYTQRWTYNPTDEGERPA